MNMCFPFKKNDKQKDKFDSHLRKRSLDVFAVQSYYFIF